MKGRDSDRAGRGSRLRWIGGIMLLFCLVFQSARADPTGTALPGLDPFDTEMAALLKKWQIPGGSLAVARDGRILLARGYGLADREKNIPVLPTTVFRLASLAKPLTAVAILQLAEAGRFGLDDAVIPILGEIGPRPGAITDPRVHQITLRHLLQHTGGFDRDLSGDAVFMPHAAAAARRQKAPLPPSCETVLRDGLERKLDFEPGGRYAYSNIGYCILGRVIERASGLRYGDYVRRHILEPSGATGLRLAQTFPSHADEAAYYGYPGEALVPAMAGVGSSQTVLASYGGFALEAMDAFGGWAGSSLDYLRFMLALDGQRAGPLLRETSLREMFARPTGIEEKTPYYGLGFLARPVKGGLNWWHAGSLSGTKSFAVRTAAGYGWVATFNNRPKDRDGFARDLDDALWRAARAVKAWPKGDLFPGE
jgi:CubicO group peptidase (beta-lactamase class C family)